MERNNARLKLPNGCHASQLTVHPSNWRRGASTKQDWYISYRFYDPTILPGEKYYDGKQVVVKGMNNYKTLDERIAATREIKNHELELLKRGYNPISKRVVSAYAPSDYVIPPDVSLSEALERAFTYTRGTVPSLLDLKSSLKYIHKSIISLGFDQAPVKDIEKRHLLAILENCGNIKTGFTDNQFNHYRRALLRLYKTLKKYDAVKYSPAVDIEPRQHETEARHFITSKEMKMICDKLMSVDYRFYNFVQCFFHSGGRLTEMSKVKGKHVNFERKVILYHVKKRKTWAWVERPMADESIKYWRYALQGCKPDQYVFGEGMAPANQKTNSQQYTKRWNRLIKYPAVEKRRRFHKGDKQKREPWLDIDLYELKHTHTTMVKDALDEYENESAWAAAKMNGHTSPRMNENVYDLKSKERKDNKIRKLNIKLGY